VPQVRVPVLVTGASVERLRRELDALTAKMVDAIARRVVMARRIAEVKAAGGMPPRDLIREDQLIADQSARDVAPLTPREVSRLLVDVIDIGLQRSAPRESAVMRGAGPSVACEGIGEGLAREWVMGPCSIESLQQVTEVADVLVANGVRHMRGGAWKPRTSPGAFCGLGLKGLTWLSEVARGLGLTSWTEATSTARLEPAFELADVVWIGARNAQSFDLLAEAGRYSGRTGRPVMLKRGFGCTVAEWIAGAEWIASGGTERIILCERGIRSFSNSSRFLLDVAAIAQARALTRLPVIADVSHPAGQRSLVAPLARAAFAAGADAVMVEVHPDPDSALSDAAQQMPLDAVRGLVDGGATWT
jgi:3-deoxy-7-phosphoheptulonate synthase / chorismate mutase